jgi:hypothetical protein
MNQPDTFTEAGARRLAFKIFTHWHQLGYLVRVDVEPTRLRMTDQAGNSGYCGVDCWVVRSDLVNGFPVQRAG